MWRRWGGGGGGDCSRLSKHKSSEIGAQGNLLDKRLPIASSKDLGDEARLPIIMCTLYAHSLLRLRSRI